MSQIESQVINVSDLNAQLKLAKLEGKNVVINDKADYAIAKLKEYQKLIEATVDYIKSEIPEVFDELNATSMRGRYCTISLGKPRGTSTYSVDDETDAKFVTIRQTRVPNVEAIESYFDAHDQLPRGVHKNDPKRVVSIRAKSIEEDSEDSDE